MKFEGYKNGKKTRYLTVTKCLIDEPITIKQLNLDDYNSYTEEFR